MSTTYLDSSVSALADAQLAPANLPPAGQTLPRRERLMLRAQVLGCDYAWCLAHPDQPLTPEQTSQWQQLLLRREQGEPLAYLLGRREFYGVDLLVGPGVLIPRWDTETLVDWTMELGPVDANASWRVLDLGTGSGAIVLALRAQRPNWCFSAVEREPQALAYARRNAARLAPVSADPVQFHQGDWFIPVMGLRFDCIVANPPYLDQSDPHLKQGDLRFEPSTALVAAQQGLADLTLIVQQAPHHLSPGGYLLVEHGWSQGAACRQALSESGFEQVSTRADLGGNERVSAGRQGSKR